MSLAAAGVFFFWTCLLAAASQLLAPAVVRRIGMINTMVFTRIPANLFLIGAACAPSLGVALGLLLARSALSQMDVPARSAFVMSVVTPEERPAAASLTAVPRSLASAISPSPTGTMFAAGAMAAPLVACAFLLTDAVVVMPLDFLRLPLGALSGVVFYGESVELIIFLGAALILGGNLLNIHFERRKVLAK